MNDPAQSIYSRRLMATAVVVIAALLFWHVLHIFLLIFLAIILAVFLRHGGGLIAKRTRLPKTWAITILILALLILAAAAVWMILPKLIAQMQELTRQLPDSWQSVQERISQYELGQWVIQHLPPLERIAGSIGGLMQKATAWLYSFLGAITGILFIGVIGLYLTYGAGLYVQGIVKLVPKAKRDRARRILHAIGATLFWWLIGRLVSMSIIGLFTFLGLWILGMPLAFTLALFAAVLTFVPNIGPIISFIPAVLLALQSGWAKAGYVFILYTALQTLESYLITPLIQRRAIAMPPALIISAQIIMGVLQGLLGVLAATPLVAALIVLIKLIYIQDILDDQEIEIEAENTGRGHK